MTETKNAPILILVEEYVQEKITETQFRKELERILKEKVEGAKK